MIIIHVTTTVGASNRAAFERTIQKVCDEAMRLEGCMSYTWLRDHHVKDGYLVYGEFEDMDHFLSYKDSHVVQMIVREIIPLTASKPRYKHFEGKVLEEG